MGRGEKADQQLAEKRAAHIDDAVDAHRTATRFVGDFGLKPGLDHSVAARHAEARGHAHYGPGIRSDEDIVRQKRYCTERCKRSKSAAVPDRAHETGGPPAANKETQKMRRTQKADFGAREAERDA